VGYYIDVKKPVDYEPLKGKNSVKTKNTGSASKASHFEKKRR